MRAATVLHASMNSSLAKLSVENREQRGDDDEAPLDNIPSSCSSPAIFARFYQKS